MGLWLSVEEWLVVLGLYHVIEAAMGSSQVPYALDHSVDWDVRTLTYY